MEPPDWIRPYEAVAEAVVKLFYPYVEVVIHDVASDTIVRIWNPVSARKPGDPSLLEPQLLAELPAGRVIGPYPKTGLHNEPISAVSTTLAGGAGLLCINFDRSVIDEATASLQAFAANMATTPPAALFEHDWQDELNALVHNWCRDNNANPRQLSPHQRRRLVTALDGKGVFRVRRAANHLAAILGRSRATVYASLQAARREPGDIER